ncbi:DMT family transporter [Variovorax humicola]|uniref:DMT family transporter n=1 Tax=Variovorax humicola TaxID=1769758 RepID=A0ABU8WDR6_9BURK
MKHSSAARGTLAGALPLVIVLTVVWGTNWVLFPLAVREVSVWTFRAVCLLGSGLLLLAAARARGMSLHIPAPQRKPLVLAALAYLVIWNVGSTYAAVLIPSGQAAVLGFTMPLWATLISWLLLGEKPSVRLVCSVVLASGGVALLAFAARHSYASAPLGFVLGLSAGIGWACGTLILKRAGLTVAPIVSTGWQLVIAGSPILIVAMATGTREAFVPSLTSLIVIAYITIVPMALGNIAWFSIVDMLPAPVSGLSTVMVPMVAMVTGAVVRAEPLGPIQLGAMACCGASLLLVLLKPRRSSAAGP